GNDSAATDTASINIGMETQLLLRILEENGDYVNSKDFPSLIKASIVNESLDKNILVVDIRSASDYKKGHIKGAVNKNFKDLPEYFELGIKPFEYDKIIMVSEDGQLASYTTALLRLMGYGNVFAMRWGMSAWNSDYANNGWFKGASSDFESSLDTTVNEKPASVGMPELGTGLTGGPEIGKARFTKVFADGTDNVLIDAAKVFASPNDYYVINYERKDKYENGHIPGAVRYKPDGTLGIVSELTTIPVDKPVVVYCGTGHNSGFVTAYLRLFGYDAHTLRYGNNGFMYNKMKNEKAALSWLPFSKEDVNDF
ncbi:MAG: hypothetical protein HC905_02950, partial [Bacteroidales bacterium]|nr:hypothetical protein [Bacteroidales bacterium]